MDEARLTPFEDDKLEVCKFNKFKACGESLLLALLYNITKKVILQVKIENEKKREKERKQEKTRAFKIQIKKIEKSC